MFSRASVDQLQGAQSILARVTPFLFLAWAACLSLDAHADYFTERFGASNDLSNTTIRFSPNGSSDVYEACVAPIDALPVSTAGATELSLTNNGFAKIQPGFSMVFYGHRYDALYVGANGYVTFGFGDIASSGTAANHFNLPRISAFYTDLNPALEGTVTWQAVGTKVVVTFKDVPLTADPLSKVSFQIEIFSSGGIIISWLTLPQVEMLAGISEGNGVPGGFQDSNLSAYPVCESNCLNAVISAADELSLIYASAPLNFAPEEIDLDVNGIPDVLNLRLLEEMIREGSVFGHCPAISAWEYNVAKLESKTSVLPNAFFSHWTRQQFVAACAGMATIGNDRFPQNLVRLLGSTVSLGIARGELDGSAEPYASWSGDMDQDGVCNRGEFEASASFEAFLAAAFDPNIAVDGGDCFDDFFQFPDGEQTTEGAPGGEQDGDILCKVNLSGAEMVPANNSPYVGTAEFSAYGDQVLVNINYNVPPPSKAVVFQGKPGKVGSPFIIFGTGVPPTVALISRATMDVITSGGFYIQITHSGNQGFVDIRGQIDCGSAPTEGEGGTEGASTEGQIDGALEGQPDGTIEGAVEAASEGQVEGGSGFEGEPAPYTSCLADMGGEFSVPPVTTNYSGVFVLSNLGDHAQLLVFHNITSPTYGALHLGQPGEVGPKLLDLTPLDNPVVMNLSLDEVNQVTRGAYVVMGYSGFTTGEIRGDLTCENAVAEGDTSHAFYTADYVGPDGIIELTELLKVIQLFNVGSFGCGSSETGFDPGSTDHTCEPADFDYSPQNWRVDLNEILRVVQLYNARGYASGQPTEDGFAPIEDQPGGA